MADLDTVLPAARGCLRATWVTDQLRAPEGRLLQYAHAGFSSAYERNRWFHVRHGALEAEFLEVNPPLPLLYRIDHSGNRQRVLDYWTDEVMDDPLEGRPLSDAHLVWGREPEGEPDEDYMIGGYVEVDPIA